MGGSMTYVCDVCQRECKRPSSRKFLTGVEVFMCETCWAIWYDGETDCEKIKKYSLAWPVDYLGAYCKEAK